MSLQYDSYKLNGLFVVVQPAHHLAQLSSNSIYRMLSACSDLLEHFGGHEQAAGLTVKTENIPRLKERLEQVISGAAPEETFLPAAEYEIKIMDSIMGPHRIADPAAEIMVITPASGIRNGTGSDQAAVNTVQPEFDCSPVMQC